MSTNGASVERRPRLGPRERRLLLAALDVRRPLDPAVTEHVDWSAAMRVADAAQILPTLAHGVLAGADATLDPATRGFLREHLEETAAHNTRLLAELARVVSILSAAGIEHLALKGVVLMSRHYPHLAMRQALDADVLVDPERFADAVSLLRENGYEDSRLLRQLVPDGRTLGEALPQDRHACPLEGPNGMGVDLHRRVPTSGFETSGGFTGWLARSAAVDLRGVTVRMCGAEDLAIHLCEHFAWQNQADPTHASRLLCDLRAIFPGPPPWQTLATGPARQRAAVAMAKQLYDVAFTEHGAAASPFGRLLRRVAIADPAVTPFLAELSHLRALASRFSYNAAHRPGYALRTFVPTRAYMAEQYGVDPRSPRIYPLYALRLLTMPIRPLVRW